jgi:hypothetical protein
VKGERAKGGRVKAPISSIKNGAGKDEWTKGRKVKGARRKDERGKKKQQKVLERLHIWIFFCNFAQIFISCIGMG